jgi:23S rRNA pseudouridine955/2504/2580 synthase
MKKIKFSDLILFEDINYVVINKPPFISSLEDRNDDYNILQLGREYFPEIQVCHRLDKNTSGCLVLAKTTDAYKHMATQLYDRLVLKSYCAVVDGSHVFKKEKISAPIYIKSGGAVKIDPRRGRMSETIVNTIKTYKRHTLVECIPLTGRLHQIRVHLASKGAPITGDTTYGGKPFYLSAIKPNYKQSQRREELPLIRRFALHSYHISFTGLSGEKCKFEAPYPKDFKILLQQLKKNS